MRPCELCDAVAPSGRGGHYLPGRWELCVHCGRDLCPDCMGRWCRGNEGPHEPENPYGDGE